MTREEYTRIKNDTANELSQAVEILKGTKKDYTSIEATKIICKLCLSVKQLLPDVIVNE